MLIERVIDFYLEIGENSPGNPFRLSNAGRCARALAYQRFPSTFKSEPMPGSGFFAERVSGATRLANKLAKR